MAVASSRRLGGPYRRARPLRFRDGRQRYAVRFSATAGTRSLQLDPGRSSGPFVAVVTTPSGWQLLHVRRVDASGDAELVEPLAADAPAGTRVVAQTSAGMVPESVFTARGRRYLLATAFNQVPGCFIETTVLGELSDGGRSVRWLWGASPVVPVGDAGRWDGNSAENPIVPRRAR